MGYVMMKKILSHIGLFFFLVGSFSSSLQAGELCRIIYGYSGNADSICKKDSILISREMRGNQSSNEAICQNNIAFMQDASSFERWKTVEDEGGGVRWDNRYFLDNVSKDLDDNGNFTFLAGKSITLCFKGCDNFSCPWRNIGSRNIPSSPQASCGAGMELVNGNCQDGNVIGETDPSDLLSAVTIGYAAVTAGQEHDSGNSDVSTLGVGAGGGLLAEESASGSTGIARVLGNGLGGILSSGLSNLGSMFGLSSPSGAGSLGSSGVSAPDSQIPDVVSYGLAGSTGGVNSAGGQYAQGAGGAQGSGSKFSGSAMGAGEGVGLANAENSNLQTQFGSDRKIASLGSGGLNQKGSTDEGSDYFTRIGLGDDIFKVVEKKYREKQTGWIVLNQSKK
jgi:hypothetical protein